MKQNLVTRRYGNLLILRQNSLDPSDSEWSHTIRLMLEDSQSTKSMRVLVVTDGGGPTPEQRKRLATALEGIAVRIAVCTESIRTRFVVSSVALFSSKIKAYSRGEMTAAYDYLDLDASQRRVAERYVMEMTEEVDGKAM